MSWRTAAPRRSLTRAPKSWQRQVATLSLIIGVAACAIPSASVPQTASERPTPGVATTLGDCAPIELRDPSGTQVSLTGTWRVAAGGPVYYVYQEGSCVWYAGGFAPSDGDQSWGNIGYFTVVFEGKLRADFTVAGRWAVVRRAGTSLRPYASGDKTWTIEFEPDGTGFDVVLTAPSDETVTPVFAATRLVKLSDAVIEP